MPIEIIEENKFVAQVRFTCDSCGKYIGTRIILRKEVENQNKTGIVCPQCKQIPDNTTPQQESHPYSKA